MNMARSSKFSSGSRFLAVMRALRRIPPPKVTREEAVKRAREEFVRRGWDPNPSAPVIERLRSWEVWARDLRPCANLILLVDMQTGELK